MLRMTIEGVGFDNIKQPVVVLKDWEGRKLLPIWIGASEARAIAIELEGARPSRPFGPLPIWRRWYFCRCCPGG